jgi:hypothetical protein
MGETKNMHFVPKTYLKRFSFEKMKAGTKEHYIYAIEKVRMKRSPEPRNIRRICSEENLYALPGETEEERQKLENMYNIIFEKDYEKIYNVLIDENRDALNAEERYCVISFVVSMFYRNNSWHNFHNKMLNDALERAYTFSKANGKDSFFFEEREISIIGKTLEELQQAERSQDQPLMATVAAEKIFQLTRLRVINDFVSVIKASDGFEFITSDNPVSSKPEDINKWHMPFDPNNSLWMPIDNKHLLQLQPWADQLPTMSLGRIHDGPFPGLVTSMSNDFQSRQSDKFLLGTQTGLHKFQVNPEGILKGKN